jgi:prepilin-type N-terminal cleavage/methylation domain-containing protein
MRQPNPKNSSGGFTLLEMVVVLVIVSLTAGIAIPRLPAMSASFDFALKRQTFEQMISGLSYQAFRDSQDLVLSGNYTESGRQKDDSAKQQTGEILPPSLRTRPLIDAAREDLAPVNPAFAALELPEGWRVQVNDPIYYRGSGYCTGGKLELLIGQRRYSYVLNPPLCDLSLAR